MSEDEDKPKPPKIKITSGSKSRKLPKINLGGDKSSGRKSIKIAKAGVPSTAKSDTSKISLPDPETADAPKIAKISDEDSKIEDMTPEQYETAAHNETQPITIDEEILIANADAKTGTDKLGITSEVKEGTTRIDIPGVTEEADLQSATTLPVDPEALKEAFAKNEITTEDNEVTQEINITETEGIDPKLQSAETISIDTDALNEALNRDSSAETVKVEIEEGMQNASTMAMDPDDIKKSLIATGQIPKVKESDIPASVNEDAQAATTMAMDPDEIKKSLMATGQIPKVQGSDTPASGNEDAQAATTMAMDPDEIRKSLLATGQIPKVQGSDTPPASQDDLQSAETMAINLPPELAGGDDVAPPQFDDDAQAATTMAMDPDEIRKALETSGQIPTDETSDMQNKATMALGAAAGAATVPKTIKVKKVDDGSGAPKTVKLKKGVSTEVKSDTQKVDLPDDVLSDTTNEDKKTVKLKRPGSTSAGPKTGGTLKMKKASAAGTKVMSKEDVEVTESIVDAETEEVSAKVKSTALGWPYSLLCVIAVGTLGAAIFLFLDKAYKLYSNFNNVVQ